MSARYGLQAADLNAYTGEKIGYNIAEQTKAEQQAVDLATSLVNQYSTPINIPAEDTTPTISDEIADAFEAWCQKDSQSKPNQVYFIRGDKTNSFKVGISSDPRARLKAMQIGSPIKLLLTRAVEVQNPESIEKELHSVFAKYRIHGEWFSMPWKDAVEIFDSIIKNHEVIGH